MALSNTLVDMMAEIAKALMPGSLAFFLVALGAGVAGLFARPKAARWARRWLVAVLAGYWTLSVPMGADLTTALASAGYSPIATGDDARGATAVVVLDAGTDRYRWRGEAIDVVNGNAALRAMETARVFRLLRDPLVVVTSGSYDSRSAASPEGGAMREALVRAGVPPSRIVLDSQSPNTRQHALTLAPFFADRGISAVVLVTSRTHIRRATWTFRAVGLSVIPSPAPTHSEHLRQWRWTYWWPSLPALQVSEEAFWDLLGFGYYWARGWL